MWITHAPLFLSEGEIDYVRVLNRVLPDDIRVFGWCPVPLGFSARFVFLVWKFPLFWMNSYIFFMLCASFFSLKMKYPQLKQCLKRTGLLRINPFYGISLLKLVHFQPLRHRIAEWAASPINFIANFAWSAWLNSHKMAVYVLMLYW